MVPLRDEKSRITFVHAHTHHTTHTELEHIVKGSREHVVEGNETKACISGGFRILGG